MDNPTYDDAKTDEQFDPSVVHTGHLVFTDSTPAVYDLRPTVQGAIAGVINDTHAVPRSAYNTQFKFNYQSIYSLMSAVSGPLGKNGLVITQRYRTDTFDFQERPTSGGGVMHYIRGIIEYTLTGPRGDQIVTEFYAEGADTQDKMLNKFDTCGFKKLLKQQFCIATEEDDADADQNIPAQEQSSGSQRGDSMTSTISTDQVSEINRLLPLAGMTLKELLTSLAVLGLRDLEAGTAERVINRLIERKGEREVAPVNAAPPAAQSTSDLQTNLANAEASAASRPDAGGEALQAQILADWQDKVVSAMEKFDSELDARGQQQFRKAFIAKPVKTWDASDYSELVAFVAWFSDPTRAVDFITNPQPWIARYEHSKTTVAPVRPTTKAQTQTAAADMTDDMFDGGAGDSVPPEWTAVMEPIQRPVPTSTRRTAPTPVHRGPLPNARPASRVH